jgi:hypothetical protein
MLNITKRNKQSELDKEIDERLKRMLRKALTPEEVEDVIKLKNQNESSKEKKTVSPDTLAVVVGNLLGIVLILNYEKANVVASKALGFVIRGRV